MKQLLLERMPSTKTETEGFLSFGNQVFPTIERPWIPVETPGGKPFESCIPAGVYEVRRHVRPDGSVALILTNPKLGVYKWESDLPVEGGRFLILLHTANWVHEVVGCIGPGTGKTLFEKVRMVTYSAVAMKKLSNYVGAEVAELTIRWIT